MRRDERGRGLEEMSTVDISEKHFRLSHIDDCGYTKYMVSRS